MRRRSNAPPVACVRCTRQTEEPRRGLCFACYQRERRGHDVSDACAVCETRDARVLRRHALVCGPSTLCANHSAIAGRRALTLDELRSECAADERKSA